MRRAPAFPRFQAVADHAVLVEFAETISDIAHDEVLSLDAKLAKSPISGCTEAVPAYVSLLVCFDPIVTDHIRIEAEILSLLNTPSISAAKGILRDVDICFDPEFSPDLPEVCALTGLSRDDAITAYVSQKYKVVMYGFAPGYAYLGGVAHQLQLPRKPKAKRDVPAGSVIIAGAQSLITTLTMPTGWWIIGRSPTRILSSDEVRPFLFDVGDEVRFNAIDRQTFDEKDARP